MRWPPPDTWPNVRFSRQVFSPPHRWHVQETGTGDLIILLHGVGGSTHSFRDLLPILSRTHRIVALDFPGQGYTQLGARHRCGLDQVTADIASLARQEGWHPRAIVGHSAGGAVALRLSQQLASPWGQTPDVIGINPALETFQGVSGALFPIAARLLAALPFTAQVFSATNATDPRVKALIAATGSDIGPDGIALYRRLIADRDHVDASLLMMSQWSLDGMQRDLPEITARTLFLAGENDRTVPPAVSERAAQRMPDAQSLRLPKLGHLMHEEDPGQIADRMTAFLEINP